MASFGFFFYRSECFVFSINFGVKSKVVHAIQSLLKNYIVSIIGKFFRFCCFLLLLLLLVFVSFCICFDFRHPINLKSMTRNCNNFHSSISNGIDWYIPIQLEQNMLMKMNIEKNSVYVMLIWAKQFSKSFNENFCGLHNAFDNNWLFMG